MRSVGKMTSYMLIVFYFGLVFSCVAAVCTVDMQKSCIKTLDPVTSFLRSLSATLEKTGGIKVPDLDDWKYFNRICVPSSGKEVLHALSETCHSARLLGMFDVKFDMNPAAQTREAYVMNLHRVGDMDETQKFRFNLCDQCSAQGQETTTAVKRTVVTKQYGTTREETLQEFSKTTIMIASILSFLVGVLTTFCIVCLVKCVSKRRAKTNTDRNADEMLAVGKDNTHVESKNYESLTCTEGPTTDRPSLDQAYLTLDTNLNHRSGKEMSLKNTSLINTVGSSKQSQIYEQRVDAETDFHVYSTLKSEGTQNPYEDANKHNIAEYKSIELENRDDLKQSVSLHVPEPELQHEQSGEENNYFLLEKEAEQTNKETVENQDENGQKKNDPQEDDPSTFDHDNFNLEKNESFECIVREISDGHDKTSEIITGSTDDHAYFKLEEV